MNTGFGDVQVSLRFVTESSDHSVSNHLPSSRSLFWGFHVRLTVPRCRGRPFPGSKRQLGFACRLQARHDGRPNRVHLRYGLIVHLRLLSTPPHGDAVTFGYGVPEHSGRDFHPADSMQLQAHWGAHSCPPHLIGTGFAPALNQAETRAQMVNHKRNSILQFSGTPATGFLGRLDGQASSPISHCCNDMLSLDCRLEGVPSVPKSCRKWRFSSKIRAFVHWCDIAFYGRQS
jgi:hypothetical protein